MNHKLAFVFISCGPFARSCRAEVAIESLAKNGKWKGPIYLITDSPHCFDIDLLKKHASSESIYLEAVPQFSHRFESIFKLDKTDRGLLGLPKIKYVPHVRMQSKALKSRIFDFLPEDIEIGVFSDCDMIVANSEHLSSFLDFCHDWKDKQGLKLRGARIIMEDGVVNQKKSRIHTGLFIAHREKSKTALSKWSEKLLNKKLWLRDPFDRTRYFEAYAEHDHIIPNPMTVHELPDIFEGFLRFGKPLPLFIHISNARMADTSKGQIESFIESLNIQSYPKGGYAPPSFLHWLSDIFYSGIFPFRSSFKIENLWKFFSSKAH